MAAQGVNCFGHSWNPSALCIKCGNPILQGEKEEVTREGCLGCQKAETSANECHCNCHRCDGCKTSPLPIGTGPASPKTVAALAALAARAAPR